MSHVIKQTNFWKERIGHLKKRGISPLTAIDIGANVGQWYKTFSKMYPSANVLSVEANPQCEEELKSVNPNSLITLMGRENNDAGVEFYINPGNKTDVGASIYREATQWGDRAMGVTIPMRTLDSLNKQFDWIKMDVQGAELDVLKGGIETISRAVILELELGTMRFNSGSPMASEVIVWLWVNGFELFDLTEHMFIEENKDGVDKLVQLNCLFLNRRYEHLLDVTG